MRTHFVALLLVLGAVAPARSAIAPSDLAQPTFAKEQTETPVQVAASKRDLWRAIQTYLKELGYYNGKIDGSPGNQTKRAWTAFARDYGYDRRTVSQDGFNALKSRALARREAEKNVRTTPSIQNPVPTDDDIRSIALYQEAVHFFVDGQYSNAEQLLRKALEGSVSVVGVPNENAIEIVRLLGLCLKRQGRYDEAEPFYLRAREGNERLLGKEHPDTLTSMKNLAILYESQGRYDEAENLYRDVLGTYERVMGKEHQDTLISLNKLALFYESQGRYDEAEPLYLRALQASEEVLGKEHRDTLAIVSNLALLHERQGRYGKAEPLFLRALEANERVLGREDPDTLASVNNLALLYGAQGRYDEAEPLFLRAFKTKERLLGKEHPYTLVSMINLAMLYKRQDRYDEAEPLFLRAFEARERMLGKDHPKTLISANNLGAFYQRQGRYDEAEPLYLRAVEVNERVLGREHPDTLASVNNLASLFENQGRYEEAEPLYLRAVEGSERVLGKHHPDTLASMSNLVGLYESQGRYDESFSTFAALIEGQSGLVSNTGNSDIGIQRSLLPSLQHVETFEASALGFAGQQWLGYGSLDVSLGQLGDRLATNNPQAAAALKELQDARAKAAALQSRIGQLYADGKTDEASATAKDLQQASERVAQLGAEIETNFPRLTDVAVPKIVPLDKAQALLDDKEGLVMFGRGEDDWFYSWFVTNNEVSFERVQLSRQKLAKLVSASTPSIAPTQSQDTCLLQTSGGSDIHSVDLCAASHNLFKALLGQHRGQLSGIKNLFVVTGDETASVPFNSLLTQEARPGEPYAWLALDTAITLLPTVTTLEIMRTTSLRGGQTRKPFFGMAPVYFSDFPDFSLSGTGGARNVLKNLESTYGEIRRLSDVLNAGENDFALDGRATEALLKASDLRAYDVVSLATHGLKAGQTRDLTNGKVSQPSLLFKPGGGEDGILTSTEATQLLLDANWVLLSACNTAAGDGSEQAVGLSGLARSFFFAGARSLLVSQWEADDAASASFMETAIENWKAGGMSKAEAVRQARLTTMQQDGWDHPYYWSVFSLVGDNH